MSFKYKESYGNFIGGNPENILTIFHRLMAKFCAE